MGQNKGFELRALQLDQHSQTPFYRQVYERIREAIASGILRPTERLPSTRSLASQLRHGSRHHRSGLQSAFR